MTELYEINVTKELVGTTKAIIILEILYLPHLKLKQLKK